MPWRRWSHNLGAKSLAFVVAVGVWLSVTNRLEFEKTLAFPVEYVNRPPGLTSIEPLPETVQARVRGNGKFLRYTLRDGVCRVDLSGYQIGQSQIAFGGDDVVLPEDVAVSRVEIVEPRRVVVDFDETVVRDVAITPSLVGSPDSRYTQVGKTFLSPALARVKGPRRLVDEIALLPTREIDIDGKRSTVRKRVPLVPMESRSVEVTPMTVDVGITIEPILVQRIEGIVLEAAAGSALAGEVEFRPPTVAVEIEGARSIVEVAAKEVAAILLTADRWDFGSHQLRFQEFRGPEVVFVREATIPRVEADSGGTNVDESPLLVVGRLPLPRDVDILSVTPDRLLVSVVEKTLVHSPTPDPSP